MVFAEECGGSAVPVLVLDNVPAKREVWVGWMLEVWEERTEVGREVVVWCSGSQVAEQSSVARNRPVAVALAADRMVRHRGSAAEISMCGRSALAEPGTLGGS